MIASVKQLYADKSACRGYTRDDMEGKSDSDRVTRLAAIMFTDIVGYSRMMEQNENLAMSVVEDHNDILLPTLEAYDGEMIDAIGDGLLVVFSSVYSACSCAMQIQASIAERNGNVDPDKRFLLRIGIHMGDIWHGEGRVFGNGVNIAARLLPIARPGGICVSDVVMNQMKNKSDIQTHPLGKRNLKNISAPVEVYEIVTGYEEDRGPLGELELVKEKIIQEKLSSRSPDGSFESRIENRVLGFIEGVMDTALNKWDSMPQEKKDKIIKDIKVESWFDESKHKEKEHKKGKDDGYETLAVGAFATLGFGAALVWFTQLWLIFPLIFIGLMPLGAGIGKLIKRRVRSRQRIVALPHQREKLAIEAAQKVGGRLTVMQLAADSDLSLEEAQGILDSMAAKGYIGQEIGETGILTYVFPELLEDR